jgi:recombinational DNA repair protein (RecF pathway)
MRPETFYFSAQDGGVICWSCLEEKRYEIGREAEPINVETVKVLRLFLKNPITVLERLKIEKEHLVNLARISDFYLGFLQKEFASFEN